MTLGSVSFFSFHRPTLLTSDIAVLPVPFRQSIMITNGTTPHSSES